MIPELMGKDHEALDELLQRLESSLEKHELITSFESLDFFWARLAVHIRAENVRLFPAILSARPEAFGAALPPLEEIEFTIQQLRIDHNFFMDELSEAVQTMRQLVRMEGYDQQNLVRELSRIRDHVHGVSTRLKAHNDVEEEQVYGWPALILSGSEVCVLEAALKREIENLPPRLGKNSVL